MKLVIATRRSPLALWQAEHVAEKLRQAGYQVEILPLVTTGDRILDTPLSRVGGKGLFVKEIEEALFDGRADLAVHSLKDVPTRLPDGLTLGAILERDDPRDALCAPRHRSLDELPQGAKVGTSSLRRTAQLRALRPDLEIVTIRGNVQTRLGKLEGEVDAVLLASAGLRRLGLDERITELIEPERMLPAVGQGALAVEIREGDERVAEAVGVLDHRETHLAARAERALLGRLEGGCQVPVGAFAQLHGDRLQLHGLIGSPDGKRILRVEEDGPAENAEAIGLAAAEGLLGLGGGEILAKLQGMVVGVPH